MEVSFINQIYYLWTGDNKPQILFKYITRMAYIESLIPFQTYQDRFHLFAFISVFLSSKILENFPISFKFSMNVLDQCCKYFLLLSQSNMIRFVIAMPYSWYQILKLFSIASINTVNKSNYSRVGSLFHLVVYRK